eukprot:15399200-Alexandrium_andersonii.AAC.1
MADRRGVFASLREESIIHVMAASEQGLLWPNRSQYGSMAYRGGDASSKAEGVLQFDEKVKQPGAIVRV